LPLTALVIVKTYEGAAAQATAENSTVDKMNVEILLGINQ
jgi:hypothetical protein